LGFHGHQVYCSDYPFVSVKYALMIFYVPLKQGFTGHKVIFVCCNIFNQLWNSRCNIDVVNEEGRILPVSHYKGCD
jgi:hypothetical protein